MINITDQITVQFLKTFRIVTTSHIIKLGGRPAARGLETLAVARAVTQVSPCSDETYISELSGAIGSPSLPNLSKTKAWQNLCNDELYITHSTEQHLDDQITQEELCELCNTHKWYDKFLLNFCW